MKAGRVVCVSWRDAICDHEERSDGFSSLPLVKTYGVVLEHNAEWIRVAAEVLDTGAYRCVTTVPCSLIEEVTQL